MGLYTWNFFPYTSIPLFSQQFKAGALAGIATTQVDGDTYAGYNKAGLLAGGFVTHKFSPESKWSASFEIRYIQKGSRKVPHPDKGDFADYKLKLNYAEVPLLLKYVPYKDELKLIRDEDEWSKFLTPDLRIRHSRIG